MNLEPRRASTGGGELAYFELGEGPPVLLLHGFPTSSLLWTREILLLAPRMRVVAPDLLGYGDSEKPRDADLTIRGQARHVRDLLETLGIEECAVVGHDAGGGVAQLLAFDGLVRTLVLMDSVCFDGWPSEPVRAMQRTPPEGATPELAEDAVRRILAQGVGKRPMEEQTVGALAAPWRADPAALFRAARALDGEGLVGREGDLSALTIPLLVLWGEDDPFLPSSLAERLGEMVDGSMVALLPGCSHFVAEDAPQAVDQILHEFLRLQYLGERHGHGPTGPVPVFLERPSDEELRRLPFGEE